VGDSTNCGKREKDILSKESNRLKGEDSAKNGSVSENREKRSAKKGK